MRLDKLTTKFQQALADAQSLAIGHDNQMIEPQHLLLALLQQDDGGTASLLAQAGVNVQSLKASLDQAVDRLPKVEGHGGEVQIGRDLTNLLNLTDKEAQKRGDQFIASEMFSDDAPNSIAITPSATSSEAIGPIACIPSTRSVAASARILTKPVASPSSMDFPARRWSWRWPRYAAAKASTIRKPKDSANR